MKIRIIAFTACLAAGTVLAQDATDTDKPKLQVPKVLLSTQHAEMSKVKVGDTFPDLALPTPEQGGEPTPMASQFGTEATVVAVLGGDGPMAKSMLRDLSFDINKPYAPAGAALQRSKVVTIAIASGLSPDEAKQLAKKAEYKGLLLLDPKGEAVASLGSGRMPRVYVLNTEGEVVWFDIEHSLSTRREMKQAVRVLAGSPEAK